MNHNTNTDAASIAASDRRLAVEQLYLQNHEQIAELTHSDPTLKFYDAERIGEALAARIGDYRGPLTDHDFRQWVSDAILPAVSFVAIHETCASSVKTAIRAVFATAQDLGITEDSYEDAEQNTWMWVWEHLHELRDPEKSKARIKTRMYAVAKFQAHTIRKSLLRRSERLSDVAVSRIGIDPTAFENFGTTIEPLPSESFDPFERHETMGLQTA